MASIIPDPAVYQGETAAALQAYQAALAAIASRRAQTLQNYGFTAQVDPTTGQLQNYAIDPNNQYGQIQQLFDSQQGQQHQLEQSTLSRGLGTSGLAAQLASQMRQAQGGQTLGLGQQFIGDIGGEAQDQVQAQNTYSAAQTQAQLDAIQAAIANQQFTPAPAAAPTAAPTPAAAPGVNQNQAGTGTTPAASLAKSLVRNKLAPTRAPLQRTAVAI